MAAAGLVPIKKIVSRNGQNFLTTVYINPNKMKHVDNSKHVQVPDWKMQTPQDLENEKNKIIKTKDPAEKEVLKDEFLKHLKSMGVTWKDNQNDAINFMRALMAAKDHLSVNGNVTQPTQPQTATQPNPTTQQPMAGGTPMSKDDAKALIKKMQKQDSVENIMAKMKSQGLSWNEHANPAVNKMRAMMALNEHLQKGGTLGGNNQPLSQPTAPVPATAPVTVKAKKVDNSAPTPGTIQDDYHQATNVSKAIGLLTGMVPKDSDSENFMIKLIKGGKLDVNPSGMSSSPTKDQYGFPKGIQNFVDSRLDAILDSSTSSRRDDNFYNSRPSKDSDDMFAGHPDEHLYNDYKNNRANYLKKYGQPIYTMSSEITKSIPDNFDIMDKRGMEVTADKTGKQYYNALFIHLHMLSSNSSLSQTDIDKAWDELGMDNFIMRDSLSSIRGNETYPPMQQMLEFAFSGSRRELTDVQRSLMNDLNKSSWSDMKDLMSDIQSGAISRKEFFGALERAIYNDKVKGYIDNQSWATESVATKMMAGGWDLRYMPNCGEFFAGYNDMNNTNGTPNFNRKEIVNFILDSGIDKAPLLTADSKWVESNISLYTRMDGSSRDSYSGKFKMPLDWEPIDKNDWLSSNDKKETMKLHIALMRKSKNTRDKWRKKYAPSSSAKKVGVDKQTLYDEFTKSNPNFDNFAFPEHKDIGGEIKCAVQKVSDNEAASVDSKIQASHDRNSHNSFKTKVNGVYRITNLPYEEKFNDIDKARNHTGFYYHGTDYKSCQKILGDSGQFVVNKTNVKAGRMLGDGVYLASQSSKSMQYIGSGFTRGIGSQGVLFLCKASLGNTVESTVRDSHSNTRALAKQGVDTLFMDRPNVVNPEWAVKEEKAVIPRLMIDVEMGRP